MRVVLAGYYPPPLGGESVHVAELARELRDRGTTVTVINLRRSAPTSRDYERISSVRDLIGALRRCIAPSRLFHLHTNGHSVKSWGLVLLSGGALWSRKAKGVLTLHSGLCPAYLRRLGLLGRRGVRIALARFPHVICVNTKIRDALVAIGVAPSRLSVIPAYLGVPATISMQQSDVDLVTGFRPYIAAAAGDGPEYGVPILLDAVGTLSRTFPMLGCVLMGSAGNERLRAIVAERGLVDRVRCLGEVARERYLGFVSRADLFVRPSLVDGDALSVREALALGRPVVASDTDARPDGVILFRRGDARDLAEKIAVALDDRHIATPRPSHSDAVERILDIYRIYERSGL
jgi:glycogen synthase